MLKNCVFRADVDTRQWIHAAARRAVKTMAQTFIATIGTAAAMGDVFVSELADGSQRYCPVWYPVGGNVYRRTAGAGRQGLRGGDPSISQSGQG